MRAILATLVTLVLSSGVCAADDAKEKAQLARKMLSAFECSTYAEMAGLKDEQRRLFEIALADGRAFIAALRKGEIPEATLRAEVPLAVGMLLGGPSDDFMLGRIFENASDRAFEKAYPKGVIGADTDEIKLMNAKTHFQTANCELIR